MARRQCRVRTEWSSEFAYVIGIITSDGNLSPDGRHINVTSKDVEIPMTIKSILQLTNKIGRKGRGGSTKKEYYVLQFGDVNFYEFLVSIGLKPAKSKTLDSLRVPHSFFSDFLRGCIDGDGTISSYRHPESRHVQIRLRLVSASPKFLTWILETLNKSFGISGGHIYSQEEKSVSVLSFGTEDSVKILKIMYYDTGLPSLTRKRKLSEILVAERLLKRADGVIGSRARLRT